MNRLYLILATCTLLLIVSGCLHRKPFNPGSPAARPPDSAGTASQPSTPQEQPPTAQSLVQAAAAAAKLGQAPGVPYAVGSSTIRDIEHNWGRSKNIRDIREGLYAAYPDRSAAFGYYRHSPVFEVESCDPSLRGITLADVAKVMGKPARLVEVNHNNVQQQISVYPLRNGNELRWFTPIPDEPNPSPAIDHLSVYNPQIALHSLAAKAHGMTLDEKIGQMLMVGVSGTKPGPDADKLIKQDHAGGIILYGRNLLNPDQTVRFTNQLKALNAAARNPAPLLLSVDEEGGEVDRMPPPLLKLPSSERIGKVGNPKFAYQVGQAIGQELQALGFNLDYAPVLDVASHPGKSVIGSRSLGANPAAVGQLGAAAMKGIQSQNVISVVKHFPGYGSVEEDAHKDLPSLSYGLHQLQAVDWVPYTQAIAQGADAVMVTHLLVPQLKAASPASMSRIIITDMLRTRLGFQGVVITDDMTMGAITQHYSMPTAAVRAVQAGADIVMVAFHPLQQEAALQALKQAAADGKLSEARLEDSVYRILQLKQKYKLTDHAVGEPDVGRINRENRAVIQRAG